MVDALIAERARDELHRASKAPIRIKDTELLKLSNMYNTTRARETGAAVPAFEDRPRLFVWAE